MLGIKVPFENLMQNLAELRVTGKDDLSLRPASAPSRDFPISAMLRLMAIIQAVCFCWQAMSELLAIWEVLCDFRMAQLVICKSSRLEEELPALSSKRISQRSSRSSPLRFGGIQSVKEGSPWQI